MKENMRFVLGWRELIKRLKVSFTTQHQTDDYPAGQRSSCLYHIQEKPA